MTVRVRVIPCLDVADGRVVKGVNFVDLRDAGDPVEAARAYDAAGADGRREQTLLEVGEEVLAGRLRIRLERGAELARRDLLAPAGAAGALEIHLTDLSEQFETLARRFLRSAPPRIRRAEL